MYSKKSISTILSIFLIFNGFNIAQATPSSLWSAATESIPIVENTTAVAYTATSTTSEAGTLAYSLGGGADDGLFTLDPVTGALSFTVAPNFEAPGSAATTNVYTVEIDVTDGVQITPSTLTLTITVTDDGDAAEAAWSAATESKSIVENTTAVAYTATSTTSEAGTLAYSLGGGADDGLFTLDPVTGALSFTVAPNFEAPGSAATTNVYTVEIDVTDGVQITPSTLTLTITVTDDGDAAEAAWSAATESKSIVENTTAVAYTATSTTSEAGTLAYSLGGGADDGLFTLDPVTGALSFTVAPNFEAPGSAATTNVYTVEIDVTDGVQITPSTLTLTITVTDDGDAAEAAWSAATESKSIVENTTAVAYTATSTTSEAGTLAYSLGGGADDGLFTLDPVTGALSFTVAPNFEAPGSAATTNVYTVEIDVTDGVQITPSTLTLTITVTDANENSNSGGGGGAPAPYVAPLKSQAPIALTSSVGTIEFGSSFKVTVLGGESTGAITYSSSGVALCAVDASGNVTALGKGTCTITATKAGDSTYASVTSNTVTVTVTDITVAGVVAVGEVIAPTLSISKPVAGTTTLRFKIDPIYSGDRVSVLLGNKVNGKTTYKTLGSATVSTSGAVTFKSKVKFNKGNLVRLKYGSTVIITKTV